ncbi:MAG TPA: competence/damage-inducible protein A [Solirubrobacteraceae bacterium]|jgi:nicotinamide-nucleotide amidase|nr:competence/damage-inducible protein A [Solirubrobacteraceae bacterium]
MSARAGIVVTGTEVIDGRVSDRNGPWVSERLADLGVEVAYISIVGDRPEDVEAALRFQAGEGVDLIVTSGGLGPTEDDLTAEVVGRFQGREIVLDPELEAEIAGILRPLAARYPSLDTDAVREANRSQAMIPEGSTILHPVGTAPGLVVPPTNAGPTVVVLPGPPRELQPMWMQAVATEAMRAAIGGAIDYQVSILRLFGMPESEIAATLRAARSGGIDIDALQITTCLRRGELEVVTRYEPGQADLYARLLALIRERHGRLLYSEDGATIDELVGRELAAGPHTIALAESCTAGLLAGRLTDRPGSSAYVLGGLVVYSNQAKIDLAGVAPELIERHGAVSEEVAAALAEGVRARLRAELGVGVTGVAGPDGGTPEKPVGLVWFGVSAGGERTLTRSVQLPGNRSDVRDRSTTVALHLLRRVLTGELDTGDWFQPAHEGGTPAPAGSAGEPGPSSSVQIGALNRPPR